MKSKVFYEKYFSLFSRTIVIGDLSRMVIIKFYLWSLWSSFHFQSVFSCFQLIFTIFFLCEARRGAQRCRVVNTSEVNVKVSRRSWMVEVFKRRWKWEAMCKASDEELFYDRPHCSSFGNMLSSPMLRDVYAYVHVNILCVYFYADRILEMVMKK